ncbi:MAG: BACON domain-containing protein, partial [Candidatus Zhuqueibacterota bacterium]
GQRIFDVSLEGSVVLNDYDIYAEAGHDAATWKSYQVSVSDGRLDIDFSTISDAAKISAIEVLSASGTSSEPVLSVTPTTLDFGAATTNMTFTVKNSGGGELDWTAAENPAETWITSVTPASGSLGAGASQTVTMTVDRSGLSEGDYSGIIAVNSNGGAANVTVQMNVAGATPTNVLYVKHATESPNAWAGRTPVYTSIMEAVESAGTNSEIWVASGLFIENVELTPDLRLYGGFEGDENSVGERGNVLENISRTTIDGSNLSWCIKAASNVVIEGFKLINGNPVDEGRGGGILVENVTNVTIRNMFIQSCQASWGAGIMVDAVDLVGNILIEQVVIWDSTSPCGALEINEESRVTVEVRNCTIVQNTSYGLEIPWHEGIEVANPKHKFYNCIVYGNFNTRVPNSDNPDVWTWARDYTDYSYIGGEPWEADPGRWGAPLPNNMFEINVGDPLFADAANGDFHLLPSSPCIGAGMDGLDIGAYPYSSTPNTDIAVSRPSIQFHAVIGGPNPVGQAVQVTGRSGNVVNWTATTTLSKPWRINNTSGGSGDSLSVFVDIQGLPVGTYKSSVRISDGATTPVIVPISLIVAGDPSKAVLTQWQAETSASLPNSGWEIGDREGQTFIKAQPNPTEPASETSRIDFIFDAPNGLTTVYVFGEIESEHPDVNDGLIVKMNGSQQKHWRSPAGTSESWQRCWLTERQGVLPAALAVKPGQNRLSLYPGQHVTRVNWLVIATDPSLNIGEYKLTGSASQALSPAQDSPESPSPSTPDQFTLNQNYPNPFNPTTVIAFEIPVDCQVQFVIYNSLGQEVKQLVNAFHATGRYTLIWNGTDANDQTVGNGIYVGYLRAGDYVKSIKMTLIQ